MDPTELDRIADLLRRWQHVEGPMERVRIVTDATDALRNISSVDTRVLAQGLWEHGAGPAAEQVAHRAGTSVAPEELAEVAQQVLNLDHREVERLAYELRDPDERRRLLSNSGVSPEQVSTHMPERPPSGEPLDLPPPPPAGDPTAPAEADNEPTAPAEADNEPTAPVEADNEPTAPAEANNEPTAPRRPGRNRPSPSTPATEPPASHQDPGSSADAGRALVGGSTTLYGSAGLARTLRAAPNARQRLLHLQNGAVVVQGSEILRILRAVPDGWQRRTVLRRLLAADQVRCLDDPTAVVAAFGRDGDRFAVAAALVRAGLADVASVLPPLRQRDADRLRRRVT